MPIRAKRKSTIMWACKNIDGNITRILIFFSKNKKIIKFSSKVLNLFHLAPEHLALMNLIKFGSDNDSYLEQNMVQHIKIEKIYHFFAFSGEKKTKIFLKYMEFTKKSGVGTS